MASIKIKNFGPIKEGYTENDGFIPIQKYMAFIGSTGSGKSTIVKLISTLCWLEKAMFQRKIDWETFGKRRLFEYCESQKIERYFYRLNILNLETFIEYRGTAYTLRYEKGVLYITENDLKEYYIPKITFIPAERNFVSILDDAGDRDNLPDSINWCIEEYFKARKRVKMPITLPINNNLKFDFNVSENTAYIEGADYKLKLSQAASGIQSVAPMYITLIYLNDFLAEQQKDPIKASSYNTRVKFINEIQEVKTRNVAVPVRDALLADVYKKYTIFSLNTIIEEIEQNLFPDSQRSVLNKVLEFTNNIADNKLILTTHSPYIIGYMTLAMKGFMLSDRVKGNKELENKLEQVVPIASCIDPDDAGIYQLDLNGNVTRIEIRNGIISGKNYLNEKMKEENYLFDKLLEIEEELEWAK
jgi:predicted ATPase